MTPVSMVFPLFHRFWGTCKHALERSREDRVLLRRTDRDADRTGRAERRERTHDDALAEERIEDRPGIVSHLHVDEVGNGRPRHGKAECGARVLNEGTRFGCELAPASDLVLIAEAGERCVLGDEDEI